MRVPGYFLTQKAPQLWLWRFRTATTLWSFKVPSLIRPNNNDRSVRQD